MKHILNIAFFVSSFFGALPMNAQVVVKERPMPPPNNKQLIINPPSPKHGWMPPQWKWDRKKSEYVWQEGEWVKGKKDAKWIEGKWTEEKGGWKWIPGYWKK